ncbi:MAG: LTA synthase family protein [Clostridium sp.]|nr:LTA synthase family protein [Clostridium sp.]
MLKALLKFAAIYIVYVLVGVVQKPIFMLAHNAASAEALTAPDWFDVIAHGLPMDLSVAGYFMILPALLILAAILLPRWQKGLSAALTVWFALSAMILSAVTILDLGLYSAWGFRLDMSPVFYFSTSPRAALASITAGQAAAGAAGFLIFAAAIFLALRFAAGRLPLAFGAMQPRPRIAATLTVILLTSLTLLAVRGGVTVSTMNLSRVYYSHNQFLNHAAVNPFFSLFYSATHQQDFASQFRYMPADEAARLFAEATRPVADRPDSTIISRADTLLTTRRPDIYLILLESFSAELFPSLGGEPVATRLDSVARDGMLFTRFYSNSFRTDRGIPAVLSGFPGAPTASVMKFARKTASLPSIASALASAGWENRYYYGGDINFTNMLAYLINTGFSSTLSDKDFPLMEKTGKWGAHDHLLFARVLDEARQTPDDAPPQFRVVQTSSSHEPFEVPGFARLADERQNAFAYTDSCTAAFVDSLATLPRADRQLIVLVPDHWGAWPRDLRDPLRRHHIPLILTGGALRSHGATVRTVGSQVDIAPTLLAMVGLDGSEFTFGRNLFDPSAPKNAFFSEPPFMGFVDADGSHTVVSLETGETLETTCEGDTTGANKARAIIQTIYDYLNNL